MAKFQIPISSARPETTRALFAVRGSGCTTSSDIHFHKITFPFPNLGSNALAQLPYLSFNFWPKHGRMYGNIRQRQKHPSQSVCKFLRDNTTRARESGSEGKVSKLRDGKSKMYVFLIFISFHCQPREFPGDCFAGQLIYC